jgi:hypothetical protein
MNVMDRIRGRQAERRLATAEERHERRRMEPAGNTHQAAVERQHEHHGGLNWGAAFFGWLVAVGMAVLLTALLSAAGAAVAISELETTGEAVANADTIGIAGGIALVVIALLAYFAGGYVAGRMSRFDGARQGAGVWLWAIIVTALLALVGVIAGEEWNVFAGLDLPRIPIDEDATTGGVIVLILALAGTLLAAVAGGKAGEAYHRRVDRTGYRSVGERPAHRDERPVHRDERPVHPTA